MHVLSALPKFETIAGLIFPLQIAHIVNERLPEHILNALSFSLEFSLEAYFKRAVEKRSLAIYKWLRGDLSSWEMVKGVLRKRQVDGIIYKEPFLAFAPKFVYDALPKCRILYCYRDGRDCADSLLRTYDVLNDTKLTSLRSAEAPMGRKHGKLFIPWWVSEGEEDSFLSCSPFARSVWMWKEMVRRCHSFFSNADVVKSGRVYELKYEDFVRRPRYHGKQIAEHLGGELNRKMVRRLEQAHTRSVGNYKRRDVRQIEEATDIARAELELCGYLL